MLLIFCLLSILARLRHMKKTNGYRLIEMTQMLMSLVYVFNGQDSDNVVADNQVVPSPLYKASRLDHLNNKV
jgi:hypothetical protein